MLVFFIKQNTKYWQKSYSFAKRFETLEPYNLERSLHIKLHPLWK